jgi:hypothetical protein
MGRTVSIAKGRVPTIDDVLSLRQDSARRQHVPAAVGCASRQSLRRSSAASPAAALAVLMEVGEEEGEGEGGDFSPVYEEEPAHHEEADEDGALHGSASAALGGAGRRLRWAASDEEDPDDDESEGEGGDDGDDRAFEPAVAMLPMGVSAAAAGRAAAVGSGGACEPDQISAVELLQRRRRVRESAEGGGDSHVGNPPAATVATRNPLALSDDGAAMRHSPLTGRHSNRRRMAGRLSAVQSMDGAAASAAQTY